MRPRRQFEPVRPVQQQARINDAIRVPRVRLIDEDGTQVGVKQTSEALEYAFSKNLDLVEVAAQADPPVVRRLAEDTAPQSDLLSDERTIFLVAFDRDDPIGFLLAYELLRRHGDPSHLFVYEVGVDEGRRRQGVATALFRELARLALARGIRTGFVLTNESNEAAMELYRSVGGTRPNPDDVMWDFDWSAG